MGHCAGRNSSASVKEALSIPLTMMEAKAEEIRRILSEPVVDLWKLRELSLTEGGLVNDSLRKLAWPKLVAVNYADLHYNTASSEANEVQTLPLPTSEATIPLSLDAVQIERDVSRVTWHLLTGNQRSRNFQMKNKHRKRIAQLLKKKQRRLGDFLNLTLVQSYGNDVDCLKDDERLRYYQGFHDIGSIVLSTLGGASAPTPLSSSTNSTESLSNLDLARAASDSMSMTVACQVLLKISQQHLRDPMRANFLQLQAALRLVLMPLIAAFDGEVHSHLFDCEMEPFFALSWIITWFAHDVRDTAVVKRLFDFFLVSHPMMPIYMSVAMTIHPLNRIEVLGTDCDFACVHNALANLPKNSNDVGWKYIPGNVSCYVDKDEDDVSVISLDPSLHGTDDDSVISSTIPKARVPFQELIDLSITLMHKIPPRNLINLAHKYHNNVTLQPLLADSSSISLLQPPPSWGVASNADSDWVVLQRIKKDRGKKLNRHQRKNRVKLGKGTDYIKGSAPVTSARRSEINATPPIQAVIASGTGPDGQAEARKLRKKRKMLAQSVAVIFFSLVVFMGKSYILSTLTQEQLPIHNQVYVEEESRSLVDTTSGKSRQRERLISDHQQIGGGSRPVEDKQHCETKPPVKLKEVSLSRKSEISEDLTTESEIVQNKGSENEAHHLLKSFPLKQQRVLALDQIKVAWGAFKSKEKEENSSTPLKQQLSLEFDHIKVAWDAFMSDVKKEFLFEVEGTVASSAEAAQEVWRRQSESVLNFCKKFLTARKEKRYCC